MLIQLVITCLLGIFNNCHQIDQVDNQNIYYVSENTSSGRDIFMMNLKDGQIKKLTEKLGNGHYPHYNHPKLSPDRSKIVFQCDPDGHDRYSIWTMNTDGTSLKRITTQEGMFPTWHPDGESIIFTGRRGGTWEILKTSLDGQEEINISKNKDSETSPGWGATTTIHPDGQTMVYSYIREKVLYKIDLKSKSIQQISSSSEKHIHPIYSPNGKKIAVLRKTEQYYDLVIINATEESEKIIAKNVISYSAPSWSKDGNDLLFSRMVKGNQEVYRINITSGEEKQITKNTTFDAMAIW